MTRVERFVTIKLRDRKREGGTRGLAVRSIHTGSRIVAAPPMPSAANAPGPCHSRCWPEIVPKTSPPTARADRMVPGTSNFPEAASSWLSRTNRRIIHNVSRTKGTFTRKIARHDTVSTRTPPMKGPRIISPAVAPDQIPKARPCSSPVKVAVMRASDPGAMNAPATPCNTRNTTSHSIVGARPLRIDAIPNPTTPMENIRRRP